jgi:sulfoxide reductase heme-binding subunit YedZ
LRDRTWAIRAAIWVLALAPAGLIIVDYLRDQLGANPIEEVMHRLGWWALVLLLISLAITPLRRITGWNRIVRYRRLVGLFAFAYATAHLLAYVVLDQWFAWGYIAEDIAERPFILAGFSAWLLLLPLALTSTTGWIRRLGRRWGTLHRLAYVAAALGTLHFFWRVKADTREPIVFVLLLAMLLLLRTPPVNRRLADRRRRRAEKRHGGHRNARRVDDRISAPGP